VLTILSPSDLTGCSEGPPDKPWYKPNVNYTTATKTA